MTYTNLQPSPVPKEDMSGPADEMFSHILLESLGLGGLGMVLMGLKIKGTLHALNNGCLNFKPKEQIDPAKSIKPC